MSGHEWSYVRETLIGGTEQAGPISEPEMAQLARSGKIKRETLVASATRTQAKWHPLQRIPGLLKQLEAGEQERQQAKEAEAQRKAADKQAALAEKEVVRDQQSRERAARARVAAAISDCSDVDLVFTIRDRVQGILTTNENIELIAIQKKPVLNLAPDAVVATNRRLIFYRPKLLGRFEFQDYQWFDLANAHLQQNMLGSVFTARHTNGAILSMEYLPKDGAMRLYRFAQEREEQARVVRHEMQLNTARASASQINISNLPTAPHAAGPPAAQPFAVPSASAQTSPADPMQRLQKLKAMADGGLISQAEFDERKRQIISEI